MKNPPLNVELKHRRGRKVIIFGRTPEPMTYDNYPLVGVALNRSNTWEVESFAEDEIIGLWEEPHKSCPHCRGNKQHILHPTYNTSVVECLGCGARGANLKCPPNVPGGDQAAWDAWDWREE